MQLISNKWNMLLYKVTRRHEMIDCDVFIWSNFSWYKPNLRSHISKIKHEAFICITIQNLTRSLQSIELWYNKNMTMFELSAIRLIILYIKDTNVKHTLISINHPLYICSIFVFFVCSYSTNYRKDILKWVRLYKNDLFIQSLCVISIISNEVRVNRIESYE